MPAPAAPSAAEAAAAAPAAATCAPYPVLVGEVCSGVGEAAGFLAIDWVRAGLLRAFGFEPWPGTLNLRMGEAAAGAGGAHWRERLLAQPAALLQPAAGFCPARCYAVRLNERIDAAIVLPEVPGYPPDKLEIVAPMHLRTALALRDGDRLRVQLGPLAGRGQP